MQPQEITKPTKPPVLNLPEQASRIQAKATKQRPLLANAPVEQQPTMGSQITPVTGSLGRGSFKGDPALTDAIHNNVEPPRTLFRSDGIANNLLGERVDGQLIKPEGVIPSLQKGVSAAEGMTQQTAEGDGPVIGNRYTEIKDPRINDLGFKRLIDRGTVNAQNEPGAVGSQNHLGIYTNRGVDEFNADADLRDNMEGGGGSLSVVPAAQMNAQLGGRRITGKLPSGATYTYHLKPGKLTPQEQANSGVIRPQMTGDPKQDSLNSAGAAMANNRRRDRARADERYQLSHASQLKEQQQARRLQLENDLVEHLRETDPDIAKSLLLATRGQGVIPNTPWKIHNVESTGANGEIIKTPMAYMTGPDGSFQTQSIAAPISTEQYMDLEGQARAQAENEANDRAGWFSGDGEDFSSTNGNRSDFIQQRTQQILKGWTSQNGQQSQDGQRPQDEQWVQSRQRPQGVTSYAQALEAVRNGLKKKPEVREQAIARLRRDFGDQFNPTDLD